MLADDKIERYSRQIILPEIGGKGQERILDSRVLIALDGSVRDSAVLYLAAAGVGRIGLVGAQADSVVSCFAGNIDPDGQFSRLNPDCRVEVYASVSGKQSGRLVDQHDFIIGSNETLHDACYAKKKPFFWVVASGQRGEIFFSCGDQPDWPCLRCVMREQKEYRCGLGGPSSPFTGLFLGTQAATEVVKVILGINTTRQPKLLQCDFAALNITEQKVKKNTSCPVCSNVCISRRE